jgi:hypothetical protein
VTVSADAWQMPWNDAGRLAPGIPPSNFWASDPKGINQVGCVYTAQGFKFDYVGVIRVRDLRWDSATNDWVGGTTRQTDRMIPSVTPKLSHPGVRMRGPASESRTMPAMVQQGIDALSDLVLLLLFEARKRGMWSLAGTTRLQKLIFLVAQSPEYTSLGDRGGAPGIGFRPYRKGPFTPEVYEAIELLAEFDPPLIKVKDEPDKQSALELDEYLDEVDIDRSEPSATSAPRPTEYQLTSDGQLVAAQLERETPAGLKHAISRVLAAFGPMGLRQLLRVVYQEYPEYTTRSQIKEE